MTPLFAALIFAMHIAPIWYSLPLIVSISLVYSATRHEEAGADPPPRPAARPLDHRLHGRRVCPTLLAFEWALRPGDRSGIRENSDATAAIRILTNSATLLRGVWTP